MASLTKSLGKIDVDSKGFRSLATAANATNRAFEKASISAAALHGNIARLQSVAGAGAIPRLPGSGGGGGGYGGRRPAGGFHGGNVHLGAGGIGLGTVGMAAGDWFWPLAASGAAVYAGSSLFQSAKDLDTERQRFKLFGMSDAQNQDAFKFAAGMRVYGMTQTENLRNFREAQGVFREAGLPGSSALAGAKIAAPTLSRLNALDSALDDESAARSHSSNLAMLKWVESAGGLKSQDEFARLANMGYRLKVGSGDTVDWAQLQSFQKRAGSAGINITGEGMARLEPSLSTLGGNTAGTALATGFGRFQGIIKGLPVSVIDELLQSGVWDKSKVALNSKGGIAKFLDPHGPMADGYAKMLTENPEGFYEQVIRPIYAKMKLDAAGVIRQNALLYGRTGGALANEWEKQLDTIARAVSAYNKTKDIAGATAQLPDSLSAQQKEFEAAWTDFKTQWGTTILPFFTGILQGGAALLRPADSKTSWYTNLAKGVINPVGGIAHAASAGYDWLTDRASPYIGAAYTGATSFVLNADARKMGLTVEPHVTQRQAKAFKQPETGINGFDSSMSLIPAGGI